MSCAYPRCGSMALNLHRQGIETTYCDVCYWRESYKELLEQCSLAHSPAWHERDKAKARILQLLKDEGVELA